MKSKKSITVGLIFIVMSVCIMLFVFIMSSLNGTDSEAVSGKATRVLSRVFFLRYGSLDEFTRALLTDNLDPFIRKLAHFCVFAAMGFLSHCGGYFLFSRIRFQLLLGWGLPTLFAVTDELHQLLIDGRSGELKDVVLDSCGAALGVCAAFLIISAVLRVRENRINSRAQLK